MKKIELTRGFEAIVDDEDYYLLNKIKWHYQPKIKTGYAIGQKTVNGKQTTIRMHRIIIGATLGQIVDHINGNGLDNRKENIRIVTAKENAINRRSNQISGFKGVRKMYQKKSGEYVYSARIGSRKNHKTIGLFLTAEAAANAYDKEAIKLYGKYAVLNFKNGDV